MALGYDYMGIYFLFFPIRTTFGESINHLPSLFTSFYTNIGVFGGVPLVNASATCLHPPLYVHTRLWHFFLLLFRVLAPGLYCTLRTSGGGLTVIFVAHELLGTRRCAAAHTEEERRCFCSGPYDRALA